MKNLLLTALISLFLVSCAPYGLGYKEAREAIHQLDIEIVAMDIERLGATIYGFNGIKDGKSCKGYVEIKSNEKYEIFWYVRAYYE